MIYSLMYILFSRLWTSKYKSVLDIDAHISINRFLEGGFTVFDYQRIIEPFFGKTAAEIHENHCEEKKSPKKNMHNNKYINIY